PRQNWLTETPVRPKGRCCIPAPSVASSARHEAGMPSYSAKLQPFAPGGCPPPRVCPARGERPTARVILTTIFESTNAPSPQADPLAGRNGPEHRAQGDPRLTVIRGRYDAGKAMTVPLGGRPID